MDEFCANKDASLRRCACSARLYDFEDEKRTLMNAEEKLKDFQKRLLAVNMDKEDAAAMSKSTAGEDAYSQPDFSESQKLLESILQKINEETVKTQDSQSMSALDLSTSSGVGDMFDSVDSMMGSETTLMEGDQLYRAALPVCQDIANEACDADDARIVQSAYQMSIEQDCDTLAKNYDSLITGALGGVREGSALLDMSRLTNHQTRNSGTILSCTKAMMEIINTDSVCGKDLGKCLDWKGEYIDPLTGNAILTDNLANLANLLTAPKSGEKWAAVAGNDGMVKFLESKKTYIEPAMETCESIRDVVWNNFIEEAMAKIKLAQNQRLEEMRRNCTTLVGECKTAANKSIENFDARALSIFGISANSTVNKMCDDVQNACVALMKAVNPVQTGEDAQDWGSSMEYIDLGKTYASIMQNCKLVGEECIKRQCQTTTSQFGLCLIGDSKQRMAVTRDPYKENNSGYFTNICFGEVLDCINQVPKEDLDRILNQYPHPLSENLPPEVAALDRSKAEMQIGYRIWGYCKYSADLNRPNDRTIDYEQEGTLLAWFGKSTNENLCYVNECNVDLDEHVTYSNYGYDSIGEWKPVCSGSDVRNVSSGYEICDALNLLHVYNLENNPGDRPIFREDNEFTNCCDSGLFDNFGNCCEEEQPNLVTPGMNNGFLSTADSCGNNACCVPTQGSSNNNKEYCGPIGIGPEKWDHVATNTKIGANTHLFCMGGLNKGSSEYNCNGSYVTVDPNGIYRSKFNGQGTEKYLNFFYGNTKNGDDNTDDADSHHLLCIYLPNDSTVKVTNNDNPLHSGADGYYCFTKPDGDVTMEKKNNLPEKVKHRVAYCENGFSIILGSRNASAFKCRTSGNTDSTYTIE